jgi:hypothetical protein
MWHRVAGLVILVWPDVEGFAVSAAESGLPPESDRLGLIDNGGFTETETTFATGVDQRRRASRRAGLPPQRC